MFNGIKYKPLAHILVSFCNGIITYICFNLESAAFDPIFFLHHSFVQKLYDEWQLCREKANDTKWVSRIAQRNEPFQCFDDPTINDDPETLGKPQK